MSVTERPADPGAQYRQRTHKTQSAPTIARRADAQR
jgi:hypothetical protein